MSEIKIKNTSKEITEWAKDITFEREGETHVVTLFWSMHEGYTLVFKNSSLFKPDWALTDYDWAGTLEELLDELTEKGECDKCDNTYDLGSRDNRCGDCGNCGDCCTHKEAE